MDFNAKYNRKAYLDFLSLDLLPEDFHRTDEHIEPVFTTDRLKTITQIGRCDSLELAVYEIQHKSENDPRVTLSRETFKLLAELGNPRALVLFISQNSDNYRLSLVTVDLEWDKGSRVKKVYSNPRRYSFFLGPECKAHTPEEYLAKKGRLTDFDDLKNRFSIEVVNKDFFTEIALLFTKLTGGTRKVKSKTIDGGEGCLKLPDTKDETIKKEFAVRLIGRLIFCWFLKKKTSKAKIQLVPDDALSTEAIKNNKGVGGYYHSVLEPLFFEVLNTPMDERQKNYKKAPWDLIPFLNGGLFNPHDDDFYKIVATGHSQNINTLKVPDTWLKELLEIFETYNFTIDENTPVDVELSIEPEMLGRIFENLLAEINPETGETARKTTGSYYTPRPIVEYMVDESLKQCLLTKTDVSEDKITQLLSYSDYDGAKLSEKQIESLIEALHSVKIIDPACGSGAFPMGILQKILLMLQKLDPDSKVWMQKMIAGVPDPTLRQHWKKKLKVPNYLHKLGIIRDCIFGVDIQPIAVEISKLRCFLSLIVDEKIDDNEENRGIEHLPNLEFKFVCANSLIPLPGKTKKERSKKGTFDQAQLFEATDKIDELKELRDLYLTSYSKEKKKIEERFRKVQSELFQHDLDMGGRTAQTAKLSQWNPFADEASSWFDPDWMFGIKDGFDVVIANPPYVQLRDMPVEHQEALKLSPYRKIAKGGRLNMFQFFIPEAIYICNKNGIICLITQNSLLAEDTAANCRKYIFSQCKIIEFSSFPERDNSSKRVFEGVKMSVCVSLLQKTVQDDYAFLVKIWQERSMLNHTCVGLKKSEIKQLFPKNYQIPLVTQSTYELLKKIRNYKPAFSVSSSAGEIDMTKYRELFKPNGKYRVLHGAQVQKFYVSDTPSQGRINYLDNSDISSNTRAKELFKSKRIVMQRITGVDSRIRLIMTVVSGGYLCANSTNYIVEDPRCPLEFILGILHSKLINKYFKLMSTNTNITAKEINSIPLPKTLNYKEIVDIVKVISRKKEKNPSCDTSSLEDDIDKIVYKLYGLTDKEIGIVDNGGN